MVPSGDEIQRYLTGAWRLMCGQPEGVELLDISADGFWTSFFAIVLSVPVLTVGWVGYANEIAMPTDDLSMRASTVMRLAIVDLATWLVPLAGLAFVARFAGIADRFVHYVIASNWGSVITAWLMLPASLVGLISPQSQDAILFLSSLVFMVALVLSWRLTNAVLAKGPLAGSALFVGMLFASIAVLMTFQRALGLMPQ